MTKFFASILSIGLAITLASADERTTATHYVGAFFGQSTLILGTSDFRTGEGIFYAYGRPEPQLRSGKVEAQMVYEGYIDRTYSSGNDVDPANHTYAYGVLEYGRWRGRMTPDGWGMYFDLGWGLQWADKQTVDLDSKWNSTPMIGFGGVYQFGSQELLIGARLLHLSNAGLVGHNHGQNQILFTISVRF
jgi:hypothetical protein